MRRLISLLIASGVLASCSTAPQPVPGPDPRAQQKLAQLLAGKVPQAPINCLPNYRSNDMSIIDGRTIAFRLGTGTTYLMHLSGGCEMITAGPYALVSREYGGSGTCTGDIQSVVDTLNRTNVGSCTVESIVPYVRR